MDPESLARCAEGLLSRRRSAQVRSHVSGCPACAAAGQQLTAVSAALSQDPPAPLPPAVAARLDLALIAEVAHRVTAPAGGPGLPGTPVPAPPPAPGGAHGTGGTPAPGTRRWALRSPAGLRLAAAAAVAVVLAAAGYGLSRSSPSPAASGAASEAAPSARGLHGGAASRSPGSPALPLVSSRTDYQPGTLGKQAAQALLAYHRGSGTMPGGVTRGGGGAGGGAAVSGPASREGTASLAPSVTFAERAALQGCASAIAQGRTVELVDRASFAGRPAIVIVVAGRGTSPATAWVVRPGCSAQHQEKLADQPLASR